MLHLCSLEGVCASQEELLDWSGFACQEFWESLHTQCFPPAVHILFTPFLLSILLPQFFIITEKKHQSGYFLSPMFSKCYIFCISLKHHRTNECRETSEGNATKVFLTPGWSARGPGKGLYNPAVPEWVCAGLSTSGMHPGLHLSLNQDFCCLTPLKLVHCFKFKLLSWNCPTLTPITVVEVIY